MSEKIAPKIGKAHHGKEEEQETEMFACMPPKFSLTTSPVAPGNVPPQPKGDPRTYTVQPGDGPETITAKFGITVEAFFQANGYRRSDNPEDHARGIFVVMATGKKKMLDPGDVVMIPSASSSQRTQSLSSQVIESTSHGVVSGGIFAKPAAVPKDLPPGYPPPKMNISRHVVAQSNFGMAKSAGNSMLLQPISEAEYALLYREAAWANVLNGEVKLKNGQTWWIIKSEGKFFPVSGPGIVQLNSAEINMLAAFRKAAVEEGAEAAISALEKQIAGRGIKISSGMQQALEVVATKYGVPSTQLVKAIAGALAPESAAPAALIEQAKVISKGNAFKVIKFGGRLLLIVAVAADLYELYEADFEAKQVVTKAGGWAGTLAAGAVAGESASPMLAGGPWGWVAYGVTVVGAGVAGYFVGSEAAETIYEWGWEKR